MSTHRRLLSDDELKTNKSIKKTKEFLKENDHLLITKADKGNVTVVMERSEYNSKCDNLLSDSSTYTQIPKICIPKTQSGLHSMVMEWENEGRISPVLSKRLRTKNGIPAKFYGLPKIHKNGIPLRPIVSCVNTPLYNLSSFLSECINKYVGKTNTHILNSRDFKQKISDTVLPPNHILVSLDVVSLFTNVDSKLVLKLVKEKWKEIKRLNNLKLLQHQFLDATKMVLESCEFVYDGKAYRQIFGSPMGSPISPACANLVMEYIEQTVLKTCDIKPPFFYRYVDDIITALPSDKVEQFVDTFNKFDNHIKFTHEEEVDGKIPFLDMMIYHNSDGEISTNWYHKDTWSGRYMQYDSWLPLSYKKNTITLLTQKILQLSDTKFHEDNLKLLTETLLSNGYPITMIKKVMRSTIYGHKTCPSPPLEKAEKEQFVSIPYVKHLYERIKHLLMKYNIKAVGRPENTLGKTVFSSLKDKTQPMMKSNIIYKVSCECDASYVGQTKQYLKTRANQHISDSKKSNKENHSALSSHINETQHKVDITNFKVLDTISNLNKRRVMEMIHIKKTKNCINKQTDTDYLQHTYDNIIKYS